MAVVRTTSAPTAEAEDLWRLWEEILETLLGGSWWEPIVPLEAETAVCHALQLPTLLALSWYIFRFPGRVGKSMVRMEFLVELLDFISHVKRALQFFPYDGS